MQSNKFRPDIEGLRGVAILIVVLYHARFPGFTGGFVGVDVFFVLSGYLITGILVSEFEKSETISLLNFYARRAKRLLPASALMLFVTVVAAYLVFPPIRQAALPQTAVATALYASNIWFLHTTTDYLAAPPETNPLLHTWSLSVEEQFYFVFPLLTLLTLRFGGRKRLRQVIGAVGLASFALCLYFTKNDLPVAFFSSPTRAWEFAAGASAVLAGIKLRQFHAQIAGWSGLAMFVAASFFFGDETQFPGWVAAIPVLGTVAALISSNGVGRALSNPALQYFGRVSYSFYLWHWVVLVFAAALWGELSLIERLGCIVCSLAIAQASYMLVEHPVRVSELLSRRRVYGIALAIALTIAGTATALVFRQASKRALTFPEQAAFAEATVMPPRLYEECDNGMLDPTLRECTFGDPEGSRTMVLFGDSHAMQWFPAAEQIAKAEKWRLVTILKSGCSPIDLQTIDSRVGRRSYECEEWRAKTFDHLRELKPDLVVTSTLQRVDFVSEETRLAMGTWIEGLGSTISSLRSSGAKVAFIDDSPRPGFDVLTCLAANDWQRSWRKPKDCSFDRANSVSDELQREQQAFAERGSVGVIDMNKYICPLARCEPLIGDTIVYRDSHHLTKEISVDLSGRLQDELAALLRDG